MCEISGDMSPNFSQIAAVPVLRDFLASTESNCLPGIEKATVPILGVQENHIRHDRTGVLYRIGDHHFILTAAHDLRQIVQANIPLYVSMNAKDCVPDPVTGGKIRSTEVGARDVSAIWLRPDLAQEIARQKDFLRHDQVIVQMAGRRAPYVFFGYPMMWSGHVVAENHIQSRALAFVSVEHEDQRHSSACHDPSVHLALSFGRDAIDLTHSCSEMLPRILSAAEPQPQMNDVASGS